MRASLAECCLYVCSDKPHELTCNDRYWVHSTVWLRTRLFGDATVVVGLNAPKLHLAVKRAVVESSGFVLTGGEIFNVLRNLDTRAFALLASIRKTATAPESRTVVLERSAKCLGGVLYVAREGRKLGELTAPLGCDPGGNDAFLFFSPKLYKIVACHYRTVRTHEKVVHVSVVRFRYIRLKP